jgi:SAM-dependent methyltransferase
MPVRPATLIRLKPPPLARHLLLQLRHGGLPWLARAVFNRLFPARPALAKAVLNAVRDRAGLEIGGPSRIFAAGKILPVYPQAACMDNVNFASQTTWETKLQDGGPFDFFPNRPSGRQWIREATALHGMADASYDFVLSSHCLEHLANPLAALREWRRVTRFGGHLVLVLPDPKRTFDHLRPVTTLAHLRADFAKATGEDDQTHVPEILSLHDLRMDPLAGTAENFRTRTLSNADNRCLHHHVFDLQLIREILEETGWGAIATEEVRPMHLVALAIKEPVGGGGK